MRVDAEQNAKLYGEGATVKDILQIEKTLRPAAFNRLVHVRPPTRLSPYPPMPTTRHRLLAARRFPHPSPACAHILSQLPPAALSLRAHAAVGSALPAC